ncbi:MAG: cell division protein FtsL [Terriglobia bacterium]
MATAPSAIPEPIGHPRRAAVRLAGRHSTPDVLFVKKIDNSSLVREVDSTRSRQCYIMLGVAAAAFLFIFVLALQHFECVRYGYQIAHLRTERQALKDWNQKLRLEQASLADPQRIDTLARQDLSLAPAGPGQVVHVQRAGAQAPSADGPVVAHNFQAFAAIPRGLPREP